MTATFYKSLISNDIINDFHGSWRHHWDSTPLRPHIKKMEEEVKKDLKADLDLRNIVIILPDNPGYILTEDRIVMSHVCQLVDIYEALDKTGVRDEKGLRPTNRKYAQNISRMIIVHDGVMYLEKDANPLAKWLECKVPTKDKQIVFGGVIAHRHRA
jgi:hypothetical protein